MRCVPLGAVRGVVFTVDSTKARGAGAGVAADAVGAVASVLARVALALVDVLLALRPPEAGQAGAQEAVHLVPAEASVAAGICGEGGGVGGQTQVQSGTFSFSRRTHQRRNRGTYWACSRPRWFRSCAP